MSKLEDTRHSIARAKIAFGTQGIEMLPTSNAKKYFGGCVITWLGISYSFAVNGADDLV